MLGAIESLLSAVIADTMTGKKHVIDATGASHPAHTTNATES